MRCKLGPSALAAGMPEPSLSVMSEIEWAGPLRPLGEVEIKKTIPVPFFVNEVKIRCPGMQARTEIATSEIPPRACKPVLDSQDTRMEVISENR